MRLVIDISGATELSGGMRLHATEFIRAWSRKFTEDKLTVFGPKWAAVEFDDLSSSVEVIVWPNEHVVLRSIGQIFIAEALRRLKRADYLISLSPIASPLAPRKKSICFQHDWRHIKNPDEFPALQRMYRKLWTISSAHALTNACISVKTRQETLAIVPGARTLLVPNGGDHPARWDTKVATERTQHSDAVVTFGHHNNKRPELVIQGFAAFRKERPGSDQRLVVLGARGTYKESLRSIAANLSVGAFVDFPGFVTESEYQQIISQARCIVLASSDEGYGLPMAEADYFGLPGIATVDSGLDKIFSNLVVSEPTPAGLQAAIEEALSPGRVWARQTLSSWEDSATSLRSFLSSIATQDQP